MTPQTDRLRKFAHPFEFTFCSVQIAYTETERIIGDAVRFQIKKNFKNTILFPTRLMGLNTNCKDQIEKEQRFMTHKIVPLDNLKLGLEVTQMGTKYQFTVEQVIGYYLTKLKRYFEKADITSRDVVLSIPSYCSNVERQSLLDAAEIAGLKCLRVINESTAIALNYGFFRKRDLDPKEERVVAFVDLGHSKTTITIASFIQGKTKIICHKSDRNLGARDFDWEIMQIIGGKFAEKYGADPRKNVRCQIRMLEAIEKSRKIISSGPDSTINVDYLLEEEDLVHNLAREDFEVMIDPYLRRFTDLMKATIAESGK
jgi:heat shock 70kDa protein 4